VHMPGACVMRTGAEEQPGIMGTEATLCPGGRGAGEAGARGRHREALRPWGNVSPLDRRGETSGLAGPSQVPKNVDMLEPPKKLARPPCHLRNSRKALP
jgi:hypothetical protein